MREAPTDRVRASELHLRLKPRTSAAHAQGSLPLANSFKSTYGLLLISKPSFLEHC